jgi:hypothetical protein
MKVDQQDNTLQTGSFKDRLMSFFDLTFQCFLHFNLLILLFLITASLSFSQNLSNFSLKGDSAKKIIELYELHGTLHASGRQNSDQQTNLFKGLFAFNATVFNPFTLQQVSLSDYVDYVSNNFVNGFFINVLDYRNLEATLSEAETEISQIIINAKFTGYDNRNKKNEKVLKLMLYVTHDEVANQFKISHIRKYFPQPIEVLPIQLINISNLNNYPDELSVSLFVRDTIFQKAVSNNDGKANFYGIPSDYHFKVKIDDEQGYSSRTLTVYPDEYGNVSQRDLFLPIQPLRKERGKSDATPLSIELISKLYSNRLQINTLNLVNDPQIYGLKSETKSGIGIGLMLNYAIYENNSLRLNITSGLGIDRFRYLIKAASIKQTIKNETNTDFVNKVMINAAGIEENGTISSISIPIEFRLDFFQNNREVIDFFSFALGLNLLMPFDKKFDFYGSFYANDSLQNIPEVLISSSMIIEDKELEIYPFIVFATGKANMAINTGITGLSIVPGIRANISIHDIFSKKRQKYLTTDMENFNSLSEVAGKNSIFQIGVTLGLRYQISYK